MVHEVEQVQGLVTFGQVQPLRQIGAEVCVEVELSRLNQKFDAQLKGMGLTEDDLKQQEAMTPEVEALVAKAKEEAKRAGEARKAQASLDNRPSGKAPGAGRRGVVRL